MKNITLAFGLLLLFSCSNDDDNNNPITGTEIEVVTGINIRSSPYSESIELGNPNIFTNNQFITYPNPPAGALSLSAQGNISDIWITPANEVKIFQQTDFSILLNADLYAPSLIESKAVMEFTGLNTQNIVLNLESLTSGYYKVFVNINGTLYWDNIYVPNNNFEIDDLINYWN